MITTVKVEYRSNPSKMTKFHILNRDILLLKKTNSIFKTFDDIITSNKFCSVKKKVVSFSNDPTSPKTQLLEALPFS